MKKSYVSSRPPPKISLRHDHDWTSGNDELGFTVEQHSQSVNSFNSRVENFNMQNSPNQPNQNPNQSVIDRGNLRTQKMCLLLKVKRPVPTRSMKKVCTKNLVLQMDRGNLRNDGTGQPDERNSSSAHTQ